MNKYHIIVIAYNTICIDETIIADGFGTSNHNYVFHTHNKFVACYPIDKTIIKKIENNI